MSLDPRGMSLGRAGEANWAALRSSLKLAPESMRALVVADASDVRNEIRRRLEALRGNVQRREPKLEILDELHGLARAGGAPLVWIEAREVDDPRLAWNEALRALNRGRDLIADAGEVSVVLAGPRWLLELVQRTAPDLRSVLDPVAMFDDTLDPLPKAGGPLCWMHLSDLHVLGRSWEQDMVLHGLVEGVPALLEEVGRQPQLLFVTGDIAARGSKIEYEGAQRTLTRICEQIGLSSRELFLVPGNHDVERSRISKAAARQHSALLELAPDALRTEVGELIGDGDLFAKLFGGRLREYCEFTRRVLGIGRSVEITQPWRSDVVMVSGVPVGVASICTSWSSGASDDKGKLIAGRRQLETLANELEQAGAALRIALLHHPLSWLCDAEERELRAVLRERFDVVLHGHAHDSAADLVHRRGRDHVEIGCGAAYAGLGQDRQHGFWVGQIEPDGGTLELDAFVWDGRGVGRWRRDAGFVREAPEGRLSWSLALARLGGGGVPVAGGRPELVMDALRRATARVYAAQSFIGFPDSAPKPRATLDSMFVPLNFRHEETGETFSLAEIDWLHSTETAASRTVVLGKPGSGKSTLCRYLAVEAARVDGGPIPLLVTVRDWAGDTQIGLLDLAARTASSTLAVTVDAKALAQLCENGRAALLIDGVDEVGSAAREGLRDRVHAFVERYPRVPVLVTSRIVGYDQAPLDESFTHLEIEDFDDEQLDAFIERWYEIAEPDDPTERMRRRDGLRAALEAEPRAKELARTPLLATLIALVHRHQAHLPAERARLYQLCIDLLVVTWPAENRRALPELDGYWQIARLEELALWMQRRREGSEEEGEIRGAELERQIVHLLCVHQEGLDDGLRRSLAVKWRRWLVSNSVLQEQQHDHYAFIHLSLMEYLAGRGVLRELAGKGHQAIAAFVQTHCVMPLWHESLLLMLGSEGHDRSLIETVAEALLDEPSWDACVFLVSMLREEVEIGQTLRDRVLDLTSLLAPMAHPSDWHQIRSLLHLIIRFGRTHGEPVRAWLQRQLAIRRGEALLGVVVLAPEEVVPTDELERRTDTDLGLVALLDLTPVYPWGHWAYSRASDQTLLEWCIGTPIVGIMWRAIFFGLDSRAPQVWVSALFRRAAWMFEIATDVARKASPRFPSGVRWSDGNNIFESCLRPTFGAVSPAFKSEYRVHLMRDFAHWCALDFIYSSERLGPNFWGWFVEDIAAADKPFEAVEIAQISPPGLPPVFEVSDAPSTNNCLIAESNTIARIDVAASFGLDSCDGEPTDYGNARGQNRVVNIHFDYLVDHAAPLTPPQHALLLALGLAQAQTTNAWPDSEHWRSWFSSDPPSDWLCAYLWHLCFAISDPDNPDHITRAEACLDRGDWPELVAELRKYPVRPLAPEIAALFT